MSGKWPVQPVRAYLGFHCPASTSSYPYRFETNLAASALASAARSGLDSEVSAANVKAAMAATSTAAMLNRDATSRNPQQVLRWS